MRIKKGDTVKVLSGNDKGKTGEVLEVIPKTQKIVVKGVNIRKKHVKPRRQGEEGGIIPAEYPIHSSKVGVVCPKCHKGQIIERKSKKNRVFYGCSLYPDCDFVSWDKPIGRDCPKCRHYLVEKKTKKGMQVKCSNCDYEEAIQNN